MQRPPISVVIPSYAGQKLLAKHLPDVLAQLQSGDEIVVVDDASPAPDTTEAWILEQAPHYARQGVTLRCVTHATNKRFAAAVNTGVQAAAHDFVWLLNNDVSPITPNSPTKLWHHFAADAALFAVGCAEIQSPEKNALRHGRGTGNFQRGLLMHWYDSEQTNPKTLWTAGGSMFLDRQKFLAIGGMDVDFAPAYEEDRDLSYRALKNGWELLHDATVEVWHQHETTNKDVFGDRGMRVVSWKNQFLLVWKNISDLRFLLQHFLWLPYHLTISNRREKGAVGQGFLRALPFVPGVLLQRLKNKTPRKRSDRAILSVYGSTPPGKHA